MRPVNMKGGDGGTGVVIIRFDYAAGAVICSGVSVGSILSVGV